MPVPIRKAGNHHEPLRYPSKSNKNSLKATIVFPYYLTHSIKSV